MRRFILFNLLVPLLGACAGGTETGNPAVPTVIGLQARSTDPQAWAVSESAGGGVISEAWVSLGEVDFLEEGRCTYLGELIYPGGPTLAVIDLAADGVKVEMELQAAAYCGVAFPLDQVTPELPDGAPEELHDNSAVVTGEREDGVAFKLVYPEQDELELAAEVGLFDLSYDGDALLFAFDVSILMDGVDLDSAELEPDGTIFIDATSNPELLEAFEVNLECSLELY
jgi:hypothetical protein